jgi:hypothetical protein
MNNSIQNLYSLIATWKLTKRFKILLMQCYKIVNISQSPKFYRVTLRLLHLMASWKLSIFFWIVWMGLITLKCYNWQKSYVSYSCHVSYLRDFIFFCLCSYFRAMCLVDAFWRLLFYTSLHSYIDPHIKCETLKTFSRLQLIFGCTRGHFI